MKAPLSTAALLLALTSFTKTTDAQVTLSQSGGVLGETVTFSVNGPPDKFYVLFPSRILTNIPLICVTLNVGLDLINAIVIDRLDGTGNDAVSLNLPLSPGLIGVPGHTQVVTLFGSVCQFDEVSNRVTTVFGEHGGSVDTFGDNLFARQGHTLSLLANGNAAVIGGDEPDGLGNLTALDSIEIYDHDTQEFSLSGANLTVPRSTHTATTLADGRILLVGGTTTTGTVIASADIYDPVSETVTAAASMGTARTQHTATLLQDGRVFVVGGSSLFDLSDVLGSLAQVKKSSEIYDPVANTWTAGPDLPITEEGLIGQAASLLDSGQVLLTGGVDVAIVFGVPIPSFTSSAYRYDPNTNTFLSTPNISTVRVYHGQLTLPDGRVMIAGGANGDFVAQTFNPLSDARIYDPNTNTWSAIAPLSHPRAYPNLIDLGTQVAMVGGLSDIDIVNGTGTPEQIIELAPYSGAAWSDSGSTLLPREIARAVPIESGARILVVGTGIVPAPGVDTTAEMHNP